MRRVLLLQIALTCLFAGAAFAQSPTAPKDSPKQPAAAPAPVAATPERTTATFGDWVMRCDAAPAPARRVCEVAQMMMVQGQSAPIAQIAFGRAARNEPMRATVVLPAAVSLLARPKVLRDKDDKTPIELTWQRCVPGGCVASVPVADDAATGLAARTEPGSIVFKDAADRDVALPMSFRGLSQALAALAKEP